MTEYEISKTRGQCSVSGRVFAEDESFYTVLLETPQGYERRDIAPECWSGPPEGAVCHFKARLPEKTQPCKTIVDDAVLVDFFRRFEKTEDEHKLRFRFVLSLVLLRKRLLKYERTDRMPAGEFWEMRLTQDKSVHRVFHPPMNEQEIDALTRELGAVLDGRDVELAEATGDEAPGAPSEGDGA